MLLSSRESIRAITQDRMKSTVIFIVYIVLLCIKCSAGEFDVEVVYFTFIHPLRWHLIMPHQLADLKATKLLEHVKRINVVYTLEDKNSNIVPSIEQAVLSTLGNSSYDLIQTHHFINNYEYEGLKMLHTRAKEHPERVFLYFHGKGMVFHQHKHGRIADELVLHHVVIKPWKEVSRIFREHHEVQKAGFTCSPEGFVWFNYMWIRGAYLSRCSPPQVFANRYDYEHYIADYCPPTPLPSSTCTSLLGMHPSYHNGSYNGLDTMKALVRVIGEVVGVTKR